MRKQSKRVLNALPVYPRMTAAQVRQGITLSVQESADWDGFLLDLVPMRTGDALTVLQGLSEGK